MANLRVLLADNDNYFRASAQRALTRQGYYVIPAASGSDALNHIERDQLDVVVTEVALSPNDGLQLLRAAKSRTPSMPVILLTESRTINSAATGVREGAFDYLIKPFDDFTRLALLIDRAVGYVTPAAPLLPEEPGAIAEPAPGERAVEQFLDAITTTRDLDQLLSLFAMQLSEVAQSAQSSVLLAQNDGRLHLAASHGYADNVQAARAYVQDVGEDFGWRVAKAREVTWHPTSAHPIFGVPLFYGDQLLGVALAYATAPRAELDTASLNAIHHLAQQAALAIELARAHAQEERLNPTDPITGLLNRQHFFELADREFRRSWRFGQPISALQLDIDDYAKLELMLGQTGVEELLRQVARTTRPRLRNIDLVGRLGIDTLGVLLLMATREDAPAVAERLRRAVAELEVTTPQGPWQVTASIGAVTYPREQCASVHDLFALAEQAARAAARAGRNRIVGV